MKTALALLLLLAAGCTPCHSGDRDGDGFSECDGDCDDASPEVHPGAQESCNQVDDDCDGLLPQDEEDVDGDLVSACAGDCDDTDAAAFPGAPEACDDRDLDCDGRAGAESAEDEDGDGFPSCAGDCDDLDPEVWPGDCLVAGLGLPSLSVVDLCDGVDQGGDGIVDPCCEGPVPALEGSPAGSAEELLDWAMDLFLTAGTRTQLLTGELSSVAAPRCAVPGSVSAVCDRDGKGGVCPYPSVGGWVEAPVHSRVTEGWLGAPACLEEGEGLLFAYRDTVAMWPHEWTDGEAWALQGEATSALRALWFAGSIGWSDATGTELEAPNPAIRQSSQGLQACLQISPGSGVAALPAGRYQLAMDRGELTRAAGGPYASFRRAQDQATIVRDPATRPWTVQWSFPEDAGICGGGTLEAFGYSSPSEPAEHSAVVTFPAANDCDGCGSVTLDGVAAGTWCPP